MENLNRDEINWLIDRYETIWNCFKDLLTEDELISTEFSRMEVLSDSLAIMNGIFKKIYKDFEPTDKTDEPETLMDMVKSGKMKLYQQAEASIDVSENMAKDVDNRVVFVLDTHGLYYAENYIKLQDDEDGELVRFHGFDNFGPFKTITTSKSGSVYGNGKYLSLSILKEKAKEMEEDFNIDIVMWALERFKHYLQGQICSLNGRLYDLDHYAAQDEALMSPEQAYINHAEFDDRHKEFCSRVNCYTVLLNIVKNKINELREQKEE